MTILFLAADFSQIKPQFRVSVLSQAKLSKAKLGAESPISVTIDLRQKIGEEISNNEISEMLDAAVKSAVEDLTFSPPGTLYLEDVRS